MAQHEGTGQSQAAPTDAHEIILRERTQAVDCDPVINHLTFDQQTGQIHSELNPDLWLSLTVRGFVPDLVRQGDTVSFIYWDEVTQSAFTIEVSPREITTRYQKTILYNHHTEPGFELPLLQQAVQAIRRELAPDSLAPKVEGAASETVVAKKEKTRRSIIRTLGTYDAAHEIFVTNRRFNIDLHIAGLSPCGCVEIKRPDGLTRLSFAYSSLPTQRLDIIYSPETGKIVRTDGVVTGESVKEILQNFVADVRAQIVSEVNEVPHQYEQELLQIINLDLDIPKFLPDLQALKVALTVDKKATEQERQLGTIALHLAETVMDTKATTIAKLDDLAGFWHQVPVDKTLLNERLRELAVRGMRTVRLMAAIKGETIPPEHDWDWLVKKDPEAAPSIEVPKEAEVDVFEKLAEHIRMAGQNVAELLGNLKTWLEQNIDNGNTLSVEQAFVGDVVRNIVAIVETTPVAQKAEQLAVLRTAIAYNPKYFTGDLSSVLISIIDACIPTPESALSVEPVSPAESVPTVEATAPVESLPDGHKRIVDNNREYVGEVVVDSTGKEVPNGFGKYRIGDSFEFEGTWEFGRPVNGIGREIRNGKVFEWFGEVDANFSLHDSNGRLTQGNTEWSGEFSHGRLLHGFETENGSIRFWGAFTDDRQRADGIAFDPDAPVGKQWTVEKYLGDGLQEVRGYANSFDEAKKILASLAEVPVTPVTPKKASPERIGNSREFLATDFLYLVGEDSLRAVFAATATDLKKLPDLLHNIMDGVSSDAETVARLEAAGFASRQAFIDWWRSSAYEMVATSLQFFVLNGLERAAAIEQAKTKPAVSLWSKIKQVGAGWVIGAGSGLAAASAVSQVSQSPWVTAATAIIAAIQGSRTVREVQAKKPSATEVEQAERAELVTKIQTQFFQDNQAQGGEVVAAIMASVVNGWRTSNNSTRVQTARAEAAQNEALRELATKHQSGETTSETVSDSMLNYVVAALDQRTSDLRNQVMDQAAAASIGQKLSFSQELRAALGRGQIMNLWAGEKDLAKRLTGRAIETVVGTTVGLALNAVGGLALPFKLAARFGFGMGTGAVRGFNQDTARQTDIARAEQQQSLLVDLRTVRLAWRTAPDLTIHKHTTEIARLNKWVEYAQAHPEAQLFAGAELLFVQTKELLREITSEAAVRDLLTEMSRHNQTAGDRSPLAVQVEAAASAKQRAVTALKQGLQKGALYGLFGAALDAVRHTAHDLLVKSPASVATTPIKSPARTEADFTRAESRPLEVRPPVGARVLEPEVSAPRYDLETVAAAPTNLPVSEPVDFWSEFKTEHQLSDDALVHFQNLYTQFKISLDKDELAELVAGSVQGRGQGVESPLLREFKILHEALRDPVEPTTITPDLQKLYAMVGYKPRGTQTPDWSEVKTFFAREAHRSAVRSGHMTPDGQYQKVVMFKPGVVQRQVLGLQNDQFVPVHDQVRGASLQRDLSVPTTKAELHQGRNLPNETTLYAPEKVHTADRFVTELNTHMYRRGIVPEFPATELAALDGSPMVDVQRIGDQVLAIFDNGQTLQGYPVEDGNGIWHLFPARSGGQGELTPTNSGLPEPASALNAKPTAALEIPSVNRAPVEVSLNNGARVVVKVSAAGKSQLDVFGQPKVNLAQARQTLFGDSGYPARLAPGRHEQFDAKVRQISLGLQVYEALVAAKQGGATASILKNDLVGAIKDLVGTTGQTVEQALDPQLIKRLGLKR